MKIKLIAVALLASAALITQAQAGNHNGGGGNFVGGGGRPASRGGGGPSFSAGRFGGGPAFRSMPMRSFSGGNRMIYSGQRFSPVGPRSPGSMEFRPRPVNSNSNMSIRSRQFAQGNMNRGIDNARLANHGNPAITNPIRAGNSAARMRNGNASLRPDWHNHVFAQHSATWHRDWNRNADHWWHGHRCHFFNGAWFIFDVGFDPWWPWWYYPYDYYGYGYPYPYSYGNEYDPGYYDAGVYDDQNSYVDQSGNATIGAVQERLAREGYYRGQIDGVFGSETRAAVAEFQSNHGLRVNGTLTNETLAALGLRQVASY